MLAVLRAFAGVQDRCAELYREGAALYNMAGIASESYDAETGKNAIPDSMFRHRLKSLYENHQNLASSLKKIPYPFERGSGAANVFAHLSEELPTPDANNLEVMIRYVYALNESIQRLHYRVIGRLAQLAGGYEVRLGVSPIKIRFTPK